jgi:hypothetical protein
VIEISIHNRNGGSGTRPITFSILALGVVALSHHRPKAWGTDNALPAKASHVSADKSTQGSACGTATIIAAGVICSSNIPGFA